ncbi:amidohydrolase family protein [Nocardioides sp. NPDC006273]|uniref:amidohydrolase family protein n=1 Tax=Nocardioides sp. NPDC006273 TaxID=3155598 RepID=UPI0033A1DA77
MIIDSHAHLVAPDGLYAYRANLLANGGYFFGSPKVSDDDLAACAKLNVDALDEVGTDIQLLSPRPYGQGHSMTPASIVEPWIAANNDIIARTVEMHPDRFAGVAGLPIVPEQAVEHAFGELERTVNELGFVGALVNPDPTEGLGKPPTLNDPYWWPLYEKLIELDVPMHIHSAGCYSGRESYSEHFITEESIAILSLLRSDVFQRYPALRIMISHGGGSVPYQIGRWQAERLLPILGGNDDEERFEVALKRFYFDSVLHNPASLELLLKTVGPDRVLFGTERPGSGSAMNPDTGHHFDDFKPVIDKIDFLTDADRRAIYQDNALAVYPRLASRLAKAVS